jgi:hypothetical protein
MKNLLTQSKIDVFRLMPYSKVPKHDRTLSWSYNEEEIRIAKSFWYQELRSERFQHLILIFAGSQALGFSIGEFDALFLDSTGTPKSHNVHALQEFGFSDVLTENSGIFLRFDAFENRTRTRFETDT